jgi:hypothetical protein
MKTNVAKTSLEAYNAIRDNLQPAEQLVMQVFVNRETLLTRKQISSMIGMDLSGVCGRVKSLLEKNNLVIRGSCVDKSTNNRQQLLGLPESNFCAQPIAKKPLNDTNFKAQPRSTKSANRRAGDSLVQMELI